MNTTITMKAYRCVVKLLRCLLINAVLVGVSALAAASAARAGVVFSDDFTGLVGGSSLKPSGWYSYNSNAAGAAWTGAAPTTLQSPLTGGVMRNLEGSQQSTVVTKQFSAVSLDNVGDSITVHLDFQTINNTSSQEALRVSLFNTAYTYSNNVIGSASPTTDADGYVYWQTWNYVNPTYRELTDNVVDANSILSTPTGTASINDMLAHTLIFTLSRVDTGIQIDASLDGNSFASYVDTTPVTTIFNSLNLSTGKGIYFDNITVSAVPEPSAVTLALGALLGGWGLARRRRMMISL